MFLAIFALLGLAFTVLGLRNAFTIYHQRPRHALAWLALGFVLSIGFGGILREAWVGA